MKKTLALASLFLLASALPSGAWAKNFFQSHIVVLDWTPNTNHTGLYVALDKGYYLEENLKITLLQPPEDGAVTLVALDRASFGVSFQEELGPALAAETPLPVCAIAAILQHNHSGIVSLKSRAIKRPSDLMGKRLATWGAPLFDAVVRDIVTADGGDYQQIKLVYNQVADIISALHTSVDAVWIFQGWDGVALQRAGLETNYFSLKDLNPVFDFYTPIIITNNKLLEHDPGTVRAFLRATARGYDFAARQPEAAADILLRHAPELNHELVKSSQNFVSSLYIDDAPRWGIIDKKRWNSFYNWLYKQGLLASDLAAKKNSGFTNEYLPQD